MSAAAWIAAAEHAAREDVGYAGRTAALADLAVAEEVLRWRPDPALSARATAAGDALRAASASAFEHAAAQIRAGERAFLAGLSDADLEALLTGWTGPDPAPTQEQRRHHVHLEATPAAILRALAAELGPADRLADLGSGLGVVCLAIHLLAGIPTDGIELEPAYVAATRSMLDRLGLPGITLHAGDARLVPLPPATVWFLFTPFSGPVLGAVLERLRPSVIAGARIASYGPCTPKIAALSWLRPLRGDPADEFALVIFTASP